MESSDQNTGPISRPLPVVHPGSSGEDGVASDHGRRVMKTIPRSAPGTAPGTAVHHAVHGYWSPGDRISGMAKERPATMDPDCILLDGSRRRVPAYLGNRERRNHDGGGLGASTTSRASRRPATDLP